jgi:hypothetical protein
MSSSSRSTLKLVLGIPTFFFFLLSEGKCLLELSHKEPNEGNIVWEPISKNVFWPPTPDLPKAGSPFSNHDGNLFDLI